MSELTLAQQRHLSEMIAEDGRVLFWHPYGSGEMATARVLVRRGLLAHAMGGYTRSYELTPEGERVARELAKERA